MRRESDAGAAKITGEPALDLPVEKWAEPRLDDPRVVLYLLEADQVVAAKRQTRFGARKFSLGLKILLWGLRVYVILMFVLVLVSVLRVTLPAR